MHHLIHAFNIWADAHPPLFLAGLILVTAAAVTWARAPVFSIQRRHDKRDAAEARRVRSLGLDLSGRETALLARLDRRRWYRRAR